MVSGFCVISAKQFGPASFSKTWMFENFVPIRLCFQSQTPAERSPSFDAGLTSSPLYKRPPQNKSWTAAPSFCRALSPWSYPLVEPWIEKNTPSLVSSVIPSIDRVLFFPIKYALTDMFFPVFPENPSIKVVLVKKPDWVKSQKSSPNPI